MPDVEYLLGPSQGRKKIDSFWVIVVLKLELHFAQAVLQQSLSDFDGDVFASLHHKTPKQIIPD